MTSGLGEVSASRSDARGSSPRGVADGGRATTRVASASTDFVSGTGWALIIRFTPAGADAWDALAAQQFHKQVALEIDGEVVSAPMIQPGNESFESFQGTAVLTSGGPRGFTQNGVVELARVINDARSSG